MKHYAVNYLKSDSSRTPQTIFVKAKNDEEAVDKAYDIVGGFYHGDADLITAKRAKQIAVRFNPPFYAHNLYEKKTHGLNYKQMRRLYAMVSRGNQKAITYARNVLGIPFSESPTQVKAVVYHHVRDLAERRVRRNPTREVLGAKKELVRIASEVAQNLILHFGPSMGGFEKVANSEALFNGVKRVMNEMSYGPDNPNFEKFSMYFPKSYNVQEWEKGGNLDDHLWWGQTDKGKYAVIRKGIELAKRGKVFSNRGVRRNPFRSGGYLRETPKEAGYKVVSLKGRQLILEDLADGKRELWARSPHHAGYAIFYKNNTYEFVTSVLPGMTPVLPRAGQPLSGNRRRRRK